MATVTIDAAHYKGRQPRAENKSHQLTVEKNDPITTNT